jgi:hypothetical protein
MVHRIMQWNMDHDLKTRNNKNKREEFWVLGYDAV